MYVKADIMKVLDGLGFIENKKHFSPPRLCFFRSHTIDSNNEAFGLHF